MRKLYVRIAAAFLMLVLIQGAGLRLVIHNALHKTITAATANDHTKGSMQGFCDCLDEALMPCTETPVFMLTVPQEDCVIVETAHNIALSSITKIFHSLRAPPIATV